MLGVFFAWSVKVRHNVSEFHCFSDNNTVCSLHGVRMFVIVYSMFLYYSFYYTGLKHHLFVMQIQPQGNLVAW